MTLCDASHRLTIDQKVEAEIPSEVRRSIDDDMAGRKVVIRPEVPKTNIRRTFLEKLCFDFMADNVPIELDFRQ